MMTNPGLRYLLFQCLYGICQLRQAATTRPLWEWDAAHVVEYIEVINVSVMPDPSQLVGEALFDEDEADAFRSFQEIAIDFDSLNAEWPVAESYLKSPKWLGVVEAAETCLEVMFRPGRGLPGWAANAEGT